MASEKHNGYGSYVFGEDSIAQKIRLILMDKPQLKPKQLCELLEIDYTHYRFYVANIRSAMLKGIMFGLGSKCLNSHGWRGAVRCIEGLSRGDALACGWVQSKARNRALVWRDEIGRLEWFETNTVTLWVENPANDGRVKQLLANAFFKTGLIFDLGVFLKWTDSVAYDGSHIVFDTGHKLPYCKIDAFKDSVGFVFKAGDASHKTAYEFEFSKPRWNKDAEKATRELATAIKAFNDLARPSQEFRPFDKDMVR